jgi:hypothetical protein
MPQATSDRKGGQAGRWTQHVPLVGPAGVPVTARYLMERHPGGSWRVDGCALERLPEQTVRPKPRRRRSDR